MLCLGLHGLLISKQDSGLLLQQYGPHSNRSVCHTSASHTALTLASAILRQSCRNMLPVPRDCTTREMSCYLMTPPSNCDYSAPKCPHSPGQAVTASQTTRDFGTWRSRMVEIAANALHNVNNQHWNEQKQNLILVTEAKTPASDK